MWAREKNCPENIYKKDSFVFCSHWPPSAYKIRSTHKPYAYKIRSTHKFEALKVLTEQRLLQKYQNIKNIMDDVSIKQRNLSILGISSANLLCPDLSSLAKFFCLLFKRSKTLLNITYDLLYQPKHYKYFCQLVGRQHRVTSKKKRPAEFSNKIDEIIYYEWFVKGRVKKRKKKNKRKTAQNECDRHFPMIIFIFI